MIDEEKSQLASLARSLLKKISLVATAASSVTGIDQCHSRRCHDASISGERRVRKGKLMGVQSWASVHFLEKGSLPHTQRWMMPKADLHPRPGFRPHLQLVHSPSEGRKSFAIGQRAPRT
jgi:hypothetical protein